MGFYGEKDLNPHYVYYMLSLARLLDLECYLLGKETFCLLWDGFLMFSGGIERQVARNWLTNCWTAPLYWTVIMCNIAELETVAIVTSN